MIMLRQTVTESSNGDTSESLSLPKSPLLVPSSQPSVAVQGHQRQRETITINNEEYEEISVRTEDEDFDCAGQPEHEHEFEPGCQYEHVHKHEHHQHRHHPHQHDLQLQQVDSIEELLGSSIESLEDQDDEVDVKAKAAPLAWQNRAGPSPGHSTSSHHGTTGSSHHSSHHSNGLNQTEALLLKLEDSPMTRRRKLIEADELVSEDEEDDIHSEGSHGCIYEEYESPHSSDDYDDITDEEDDDEDDDAWSGGYVYEEIELPDHITPIRKNWMNSWFSSTHQSRMEHISEGEEDDSDSGSEGSFSLKEDGKTNKGTDLDKSWGSLDSHMRSWHSQRSHRSHSPHYQVMSTPPLLRDIKALLPAKSPIRPTIPKAKKSDQPPPKQAENLVRTKEAVEEQELNDSLRQGDRTAFLKAKRKAAALKKQRQKKKDKDKDKAKPKGKKSSTSRGTSATGGKQAQQPTSILDVMPVDTGPESITSALSHSVPDQSDASTKTNINSVDNTDDTKQTNNDVNNVSDSKSKSKRKPTSLKVESSTHEGSKSARTLEGTEVENSARSKSKSKRNAKTKTKTTTTGSSTDKDIEKSDRSTSKSTRRLKAAMEEAQAGDGDSASSRRRKVKDNSDDKNLASPTKTKKRSKTKPTVSMDPESDLATQDPDLPFFLDTPTGTGQHANAPGSGRLDPIGENVSDLVVSNHEDTTNDDENCKSTDENSESLQKPDSKRSKRGKGSLARLHSLPNITSCVPDDDCANTSQADTVKTSDKKRPKSPKSRKSDIKQHSLQQLILNSPAPLDTANPSKPSSQRSQNSLNSPTDDSVSHEVEESTAKLTILKSPRTKAKLKVSSSSTLDSEMTKKSSSSKKSKSTAKKNDIPNDSSPDDENSSIKSRSTSARSKSTSSKSRRKSDDKSQSTHKPSASPDDDSQQPSKPPSTGKRGGKRTSSIQSLDAQRRSDPNLTSNTGTTNDDTSSDRQSVSPRKTKSLVDLSQFKSPPPSPSPKLTNSSWSKVENDTSFLQLDITNDGQADAKRLSTARPVKSSLLSQMSWNEKTSQRNDAKVPLSLRNLKASGSTQGEGNQLEEHDTPSASNRKAGFFRFLISPLRRAKSFSERPKMNLKEQNSRASILLSPSQGSSRNIGPKGHEKKSHSLHQFSTVTFLDGTPSLQHPLDLRIVPVSSNANVTSNDTVATMQANNGTGAECINPNDENMNSESVQLASLSQLKDDSAGTIKTSMMSLSLDEENSLNDRTGAEGNVDAVSEIPIPEKDESTIARFASVAGKIHVRPKSFRVASSSWKNVFADDHQEVSTRRTST